MSEFPSSIDSSAPAPTDGYVPYVAPPSETPPRTIETLAWDQPLRWLGQAAWDLPAQPAVALFYGVCFWVMAALLAVVFRNQPQYTMSMASGCLLLGPFLAMGLYEASRRRALGLPCSLADSALCWRAHVRSMGLLLLVLMVLELLWGRASLVVFAVFFNTGMPSTTGVLQAVFNPDNLDFVVAYVAVGAVFAALGFATAVVSIPMILDRDTDAVSACITSFGVVFANPGVMLLWGGLITGLVTVALVLPWQLGFLLVGPLLGHASWHAYRASVRWPDQG